MECRDAGVATARPHAGELSSVPSRRAVHAGSRRLSWGLQPCLHPRRRGSAGALSLSPVAHLSTRRPELDLRGVCDGIASGEVALDDSSREWLAWLRARHVTESLTCRDTFGCGSRALPPERGWVRRQSSRALQEWASIRLCSDHRSRRPEVVRPKCSSDRNAVRRRRRGAWARRL